LHYHNSSYQAAHEQAHQFVSWKVLPPSSSGAMFLEVLQLPLQPVHLGQRSVYDDQEGTAQKMLEEMAELQKNLNVFHSLCKSLLEDYKPSSTLFETLAQRRRQLPADKSEGCPNNSQPQ